MPQMYGEFFYFGICHFCKNYSEEIRRCSSCKTVAYCSKQHQKLDWKNHKELCKVIALTTKKLAEIQICSFEEWINYRISCQTAWINTIKRQLKPFECQMWMFPRICNICYSRENLIDCEQCRNTAYCSHEHMEQDKLIHGKFCDDLKLCMDVDRYLARENVYPQIQLKDKIIPSKKFPDDIGKLIDLVENKSIFDDSGQVLEQLLKADSIAPGAIILYALGISSVTQFQQNKLILHIVGPSVAEGTADWRLATELIFHWTKYLSEISYIFIGPEAWNISLNDFELCQTCKKQQKVLKVKVYTQLYHEVANCIRMPNLVISFNSGLHEFEGRNCDQWNESIPMLIKNTHVPFVFTAYTEEEMLKDLKRIKNVPNLRTEILITGRNPFASPRPIRDWCTKGIPIFYSNGYISIVKRLEESEKSDLI